MDMLIRYYGGSAKENNETTDNLELIKDIIENIKK